MKDILTTGLGMFIFGDVRFEPRNVVGVVIGLSGGIFYSYFSYRDSQQRPKDTVRFLHTAIDGGPPINPKAEYLCSTLSSTFLMLQRNTG